MINLSECEDDRTARILTDIANSVLPGIIMEYDVPSKHSNYKLAILDMEVWMDSLTGNMIF